MTDEMRPEPAETDAEATREPVREPHQGEQGAWDGAVAIAKGMATVFKQTFRPDNTERYPKEIAPIPERSHVGRHRLNRHDDGL
jgi:hypothetical protein